MNDPLSNLLSTIAVNEARWSVIKLSSEWGFHSSPHRQIQCHLVDLTLNAIDRRFGAEDQLADAEVAGPIGFDGAQNRLLSHPSHDQKVLFEVVKTLVKFDPSRHQPNLPVM